MFVPRRMKIGVHDCSVAHKEKPVFSRVGEHENPHTLKECQRRIERQQLTRMKIVVRR